MALRNTIPNNGLQLLVQFLGITLESPKRRGLDDVIFILIDFEHLRNIKKDSTENFDNQVGIAVLETKNLISSPPETAISRYGFVTGSHSYCASTTRKFLFETIGMHQRDILTRLESLIIGTRDIFLVGHDFNHTLNILQYLKFDLHMTIVGLLDTQTIASKMMQSIQH